MNVLESIFVCCLVFLLSREFSCKLVCTATKVEKFAADRQSATEGLKSRAAHATANGLEFGLESVFCFF